jgi:hypothetical protein
VLHALVAGVRQADLLPERRELVDPVDISIASSSSW